MSREITQLESLEAENGNKPDYVKEPQTPVIEKSAKFDELQDCNNQDESKYKQSDHRTIDPSQGPTLPSSQPESRMQEAVNNLSSPLLGKGDKAEAKNYGYSFNSKRVAQGPAFFNLRIMCHCLGKALKRHIEFSKGAGVKSQHEPETVCWFLDELQEIKA